MNSNEERQALAVAAAALSSIIRSPVLVEGNASSRTVVLNRPPFLNALNTAMINAISGVFLNTYWTGYFTSKPAFKGYVRTMSGYLLELKEPAQLSFQFMGTKWAYNLEFCKELHRLRLHGDTLLIWWGRGYAQIWYRVKVFRSNAKFKDHFVCFGRSRTCMEQWYVHAHACMGMEASWSDSMGAKTVYGQLTPSGIEDRMVGEQVG
ncbi:hypothetical protein LXL04_028819 [Taraxacum kok-saghyz]